MYEILSHCYVSQVEVLVEARSLSKDEADMRADASISGGRNMLQKTLENLRTCAWRVEAYLQITRQLESLVTGQWCGLELRDATYSSDVQLRVIRIYLQLYRKSLVCVFMT